MRIDNAAIDDAAIAALHAIRILAAGGAGFSPPQETISGGVILAKFTQPCNEAHLHLAAERVWGDTPKSGVP